MRGLTRTAPLPVIILALTIASSIFLLWKYTNGYPYIYQNEESYLSYIHAWFLNYDHPFTFSFLTRENFEGVYTHNPNMPRYAHYLLMKLGVLEFTRQLLIITIFASVGSILLFYWAIKDKIHDFIIILLSLIFFTINPQFILFSHNSYRVFSFFLFALMVYSTSSKRRKLMFFSSFVLFQFEYAFAIFTAASCLAYMFLDGIKKNRATILYLVLGAAASIIVFALQIISHHTFSNLIKEMFIVVLPARSIGDRTLIEILSALKYVVNRSNDNHWLIYITCLAFIILGAIGLRWCKKNIPKLYSNYEGFVSEIDFTSKFLCSVFVGGMVVTILLPGYCIDAYGNYRFPFICFHELAVFMFLLSLSSIIFQICLKKYYTKTTQIILLSCVALYPICEEVTLHNKYLPEGYSNINKGGYIDEFRAYNNKHYITNFGAVAAFKDQPRPVHLAYGLASIETTIIKYKEKYALEKLDPIYYICVQQEGYNCTTMVKEIRNKWAVNLITQEKDYAVIEFPYNILGEFTRLNMSIADESWVELGLNLLNRTSIKNSLANTMIVRNVLLSGKPSPSDLNVNTAEMLRSFKEIEGVLREVKNSSFAIDPRAVKNLKDKYPLTWRAAMISAISKSLSESEKKLFCTEENIARAVDLTNKYDI